MTGGDFLQVYGEHYDQAYQVTSFPNLAPRALSWVVSTQLFLHHVTDHYCSHRQMVRSLALYILV